MQPGSRVNCARDESLPCGSGGSRRAIIVAPFKFFGSFFTTKNI